MGKDFVKKVEKHTYIGTKKVEAFPCQVWKDIEGHKLVDDGYRVIYEDGYLSWSPKDVFEKAYKKADTYIDRMEIEYAELNDRRAKLAKFLECRDLDDSERSLLTDQLVAMNEYSLILMRRIDYAKLKEANVMPSSDGPLREG